VLLLGTSVQRSQAQNIHILMAADTNDASLGKCCSISVERVRGMLSYLIPQDRYRFQTLESARGDYRDGDTVLRAIRNFQVPRGDTFVFFYHGHGGANGKRHFLHMPDNQPLYSNDVKEAVKAKSCRLSIIMTCSCNVPVRGVGEAASPAEAWNVDTQGIAPVMEDLFINHTGLYHTNSAWPGQKSWSDQEVGSWFFHAFCSYCTLHPSARPTWWCMDRMLDRNLKARFAMFKQNGWFRPGDVGNQDTFHTIYWPPLPKAQNFGKRRFGAQTSDDRVRTGVQVTGVYRGEPATQITVTSGGNSHRTSLQRGDVLLAINGQQIKDWNTYFELVRLSNRTMYFTFRRGGTVYEGETMLSY